MELIIVSGIQMLVMMWAQAAEYLARVRATHSAPEVKGEGWSGAAHPVSHARRRSPWSAGHLDAAA